MVVPFPIYRRWFRSQVLNSRLKCIKVNMKIFTYILTKQDIDLFSGQSTFLFSISKKTHSKQLISMESEKAPETNKVSFTMVGKHLHRINVQTLIAWHRWNTVMSKASIILNESVFKQFSKVDISGNILTLDDKEYTLSNDNNTKIRKKCCSCQRHR